MERSVLAVEAVAIGIGTLLALVVWQDPYRTLVFSGLLVTAVLASAFGLRQSTRDDWQTMSPSFVVECTALLLLGAHAMTFVAVAAMMTRGQRVYPLKRLLRQGALVVLATYTAGLAYSLLGGVPGEFAWPWQGAAIAAAVVAYSLVRSATADVVVPRLTHQDPPRWVPSLVKACPQYVIGASLAALVAELIHHQRWDALAMAMVPLFFADRTYRNYVRRVDEERRSREVIEASDQAMAAMDNTGVITLWNDALEQLVECSPTRAVGRMLTDALPALRACELPSAVTDALREGRWRIVPYVGLPVSDGSRILQITVLPVVGGATLLWHDVTTRVRAEQAVKRNEERLALAAEGANDGLWEWDLRTNEFYVSKRWKIMVGLHEGAGILRPEDWISRVHDDDVVPLKQALDAYIGGKSTHFELEHRIRHADGTYRRFFCRGVAVTGTDRRPTRIAGSLTDTTDRAREQEQLRNASYRDSLTGLANRSIFVDGLGRRLAEFQRQHGERFAVLYLDLDRFKIINDSLGHMVGDELLVAVSRRLEQCLRPADSLARLGGDEFAILLNGLNDESQANAIAFRIQESLRAPFSIDGRQVFTSASIGIAPGLAEYTSPEEIMRDADMAMYYAKARGKARHELFDADMHARTRDRLDLENDLRRAVSHHQFEMKYQPIVSLTTGMCVGFESLVRWDRNGESVSPSTFIPIAEELGLIESLGEWVLEQACAAFADWQRQFPDSGLDWITVNVSSRQLTQQRNFVRIVQNVIERSGISPGNLGLEITETALMDSPQEAAAVLRELRDSGVKIYLDDFGTGYSSLSHLHRLPVDALKIDRSFVKSLLLPDRPATVESILALARTLNTSVVAEGIENDVQARELERLGCTHAQGYLFSRPLSAQAVTALLTTDEPLGPRHVETGQLSIPAELEVYFSKSAEWPEQAATH